MTYYLISINYPFWRSSVAVFSSFHGNGRESHITVLVNNFKAEGFPRIFGWTFSPIPVMLVLTSTGVEELFL